MVTRVVLADQAEARFYEVDTIDGALRSIGEMSDANARRHEALAFASRIAQSLESARSAHEFDELVVMAAPRFMGMLRAVMPQHLYDLVVIEVLKDLIHEPEDAIRALLPLAAVRTRPHLSS